MEDITTTIAIYEGQNALGFIGFDQEQGMTTIPLSILYKNIHDEFNDLILNKNFIIYIDDIAMNIDTEIDISLLLSSRVTIKREVKKNKQATQIKDDEKQQTTKEKKGILILTALDVMEVLTMSDCIDVLELAFIELANNTAVLPLRTSIKPPNGIALYMPAYLQQSNALACKIVTVYKKNPINHNMSTTLGKVLLQDPETGDVICIMDGGYLTAVRTGAVSGLATKWLANKTTSDNPFILLLFGAGVQGKQQIIAIITVTLLSKVYISDMNSNAAISLKEDLEIIYPNITFNVILPNENIDIYIEQSDIICTATSSSNPVFDGSKVKPGAHINGIGSHSPGARELDSDIIQRSRLFVDSVEGCLNEAGDIMIPLQQGLITKEHMVAELGEIITKQKAGRTSNSQITTFKSNGLAIQDVATAKLVYDKAIEQSVGQFVQI